MIRVLAAESPAITALNLDPFVCPRVVLCDAIIDGLVVRRDAHHLTPEFAVSLTPVLSEVVEQVLGLD